MSSQSELLLPPTRPKPSRINRWRRNLQASWHDTRALISEFRRPLLAFLISVFVGGWIYGELTVIAGYDRIAFIDLPYIMMALMIFEAPSEVPPEWYLVFFWYLQPLVGVYILGQGAADFIRLFIDRSGRKNAWEVAVASTYSRHVVVIGIGHVGLRIIRTLVDMGFEVVAVSLDISDDVKSILDQWHVPLIMGDARLIQVLEDARVDRADACVVCTSSDHVNLEVTMRVRDLNDDIRVVTRMWDDRFAQQLRRFMNVDVLSASDLSAPAFAGAAVGIQVLQTLDIENERYGMIQLKVEPGSTMEGKTIGFLQEDENVDIVLHGRGSVRTVHPDEEALVQAQDLLVLFADYSQITEIVARNRPSITS